MKGIAWIGQDALDVMHGEAGRAYPLETGGVLIGYWAPQGREVVVVKSIGPGPCAKHFRAGFEPDYSFHEAQVAKFFRASKGICAYLGDWHTHPDSADPIPSFKDRRTMKRIATHREARAPEPLMAILGGSGPWSISIWKGSMRSYLPGIRIEKLAVQSFSL